MMQIPVMTKGLSVYVRSQTVSNRIKSRITENTWSESVSRPIQLTIAQ